MELISIPLSLFATKFLIKKWSQPRLFIYDSTIPYEELLTYAKLSCMAYNEPDQFKIPEVSEIKFIHQKHTKLYVWKQDTTMYVVFRGTDDLGDVKDDINVRLRLSVRR